MPLRSKFFTESTGKKIVKIDQYLAKIWTKCNSLFFGSPCMLGTCACWWCQRRIDAAAAAVTRDTAQFCADRCVPHDRYRCRYRYVKTPAVL